jgi:hypothetical protein
VEVEAWLARASMSCYDRVVRPEADIAKEQARAKASWRQGRARSYRALPLADRLRAALKLVRRLPKTPRG